MNTIASPRPRRSDTSTRRTRTVMAASVGFVLLLTAACGSSGHSSSGSTTTTAATGTSTTTAAAAGAGSTTLATSATTTTTASATTVASGATTTASTPSAGCTTGSAVIPKGAVTEKTLDVDGDGRPDTLWLGGGDDREVGIVTAAGGGSSVTINSASPVPLSAFVVNAQGSRPYQILVSDNRVGYLLVWTGCQLQTVHNKQGAAYTFDLGFGDYGTGVGCNTIDGQPHLVGLKGEPAVGNTVKWTRTVVNVNGTLATNGITQTGTFTLPGDQHGVDLLNTLSCGNETITGNGITAPE